MAKRYKKYLKAPLLFVVSHQSLPLLRAKNLPWSIVFRIDCVSDSPAPGPSGPARSRSDCFRILQVSLRDLALDQGRRQGGVGVKQIKIAPKQACFGVSSAVVQVLRKTKIIINAIHAKSLLLRHNQSVLVPIDNLGPAAPESAMWRLPHLDFLKPPRLPYRHAVRAAGGVSARGRSKHRQQVPRNVHLHCEERK